MLFRSAFAYGVQIERAHDAFEFLVIRAAEKFHAQPSRARMRGRWRSWWCARKYVKRRVHGHECEKIILRAARAGNNFGRSVVFPAEPGPGRACCRGEDKEFEVSEEIPLKNLWGSPIVNVSVPGNYRGRA